jgi:hypothetical protein
VIDRPSKFYTIYVTIGGSFYPPRRLQMHAYVSDRKPWCSVCLKDDPTGWPLPGWTIRCCWVRQSFVLLSGMFMVLVCTPLARATDYWYQLQVLP